jgi:tRNA A37 N6-isopentenylltransferase MiaA
MLANKFVVIMGATGTGKTKLSIDVAKAWNVRYEMKK